MQNSETMKPTKMAAKRQDSSFREIEFTKMVAKVAAKRQDSSFREIESTKIVENGRTLHSESLKER